MDQACRQCRQFWHPATFHASDVGGGTISFPLPGDRNNVAPRIGVSYDVSGDGRTIARGSYGVFYDNIILLAENPGRVLNGASDLMVAAFGDKGRHARTTVGVAALPSDAAVEVEGVFEVS